MGPGCKFARKPLLLQLFPALSRLFPALHAAMNGIVRVRDQTALPRIGRISMTIGLKSLAATTPRSTAAEAFAWSGC